jgi:drug/metabolite transporter (DMT)-like permease
MPNSTYHSKNIDLKATVILVVCCLIWGGGLVMVKLANAGLSPVLNSGLRSLCAGLILLAWASMRSVPLANRDGTLRDGLIAGTVFSLEFLALYTGLSMTTASRGTIFLHCAPFVAAYGEHLFVPGHRLNRQRFFGLAAAFLGLVVALGDGLWTGVSSTVLMGDMLCLVGGIFWGVITVVVRSGKLRTAPPEKTLLYQLGVSTIILLLWSVLSGEFRFGPLDQTSVLAFAYTVVLVAVLGYQTWFWLMRTYSAATLHSFTFLTPIFGVFAGYFLLGEPVTAGTLVGLALVALGIYLVNRPETVVVAAPKTA